MTTKTLSGTYSAGYTLSTAYDGLVIASSASIGGSGLVLTGFADVSNDGRVQATLGANGITLGAGGPAVVNASTGFIGGGGRDAGGRRRLQSERVLRGGRNAESGP